VQAPQEEEAADGEVPRLGELRADDPPELLADEPQLDRARLRARKQASWPRPAFGLGQHDSPVSSANAGAHGHGLAWG
jgi:hypothetical protein